MAKIISGAALQPLSNFKDDNVLYLNYCAQYSTSSEFNITDDPLTLYVKNAPSEFYVKLYNEKVYSKNGTLDLRTLAEKDIVWKLANGNPMYVDYPVLHFEVPLKEDEYTIVINYTHSSSVTMKYINPKKAYYYLNSPLKGIQTYIPGKIFYRNHEYRTNGDPIVFKNEVSKFFDSFGNACLFFVPSDSKNFSDANIDAIRMVV